MSRQAREEQMSLPVEIPSCHSTFLKGILHWSFFNLWLKEGRINSPKAIGIQTAGNRYRVAYGGVILYEAQK
jgi:hypothetical protein